MMRQVIVLEREDMQALRTGQALNIALPNGKVMQLTTGKTAAVNSDKDTPERKEQKRLYMQRYNAKKKAASNGK